MSKQINKAIGLSMNALQSARRAGVPASLIQASIGELNRARSLTKTGDIVAARFALIQARDMMEYVTGDAKRTFNAEARVKRVKTLRRSVPAMLGLLAFMTGAAFSSDQANAKPAFYMNAQGGLNYCAEVGNAFRTKSENAYCAGVYSHKFDPRGFDCQFAETQLELSFCGKAEPTF